MLYLINFKNLETKFHTKHCRLQKNVFEHSLTLLTQEEKKNNTHTHTKQHKEHYIT